MLRRLQQSRINNACLRYKNETAMLECVILGGSKELRCPGPIRPVVDRCSTHARPNHGRACSPSSSTLESGVEGQGKAIDAVHRRDQSGHPPK